MKLQNERTERILWEDLSLYEKICQMMIVKANPGKHIEQYGSIRNFMETCPVGGIFICNDMIYGQTFTLEMVGEVVAEYQKYSKIPLLVAADTEMGAKGLSKNFTRLPPCMALASVGEEALAYDYGKAIAKEAVSTGVNWAFAPVCDLPLNRYNEIIGTRAITDDPEMAARLLSAEIRGFQEQGMLTTGKHFPGDGCDVRNQHLVTSVNPLSREAWMESYGKVFQKAFDAGMSAVMVGHISLPAVQTDDEDGVYPPGTLSADIFQFLKKELGFQGAAITDAMDMGGFVRWKYSRAQAEVEAFKAGADMLLWPGEKTAETIAAKLRSGEIPMERLEDAVSRIAYLKSKLEPFGFAPIPDETGSEFSRKTSARLAKRCSVLAANRLNLIPIDKNRIKKVRIVTATELFLSTRDNADACSEFIKELFEQRGAEAEIKKEWDVYTEKEEEIDRDYDLIVYCAYSNSAIPMPCRELVNLHSAQRFDNEKTIVLVIGTPHYITEYFPTAETVIHTYPHRECLRAAVEGIYGERAFEGKLPIRI